MILFRETSAKFLIWLTLLMARNVNPSRTPLFSLRGSFGKRVPWDFWTALASAIVVGNCLDGAAENVVVERYIIVK